MNLYELTAEFQHLQSLLENGEDGFEDEIARKLYNLEEDIEDKADGYARVIKNFEGDIEAIKAEEKRLKEKRAVLEKSIERLKGNLKESMIVTGKTKFKTDLFSFSVVNNGGSLPVILDVPVEELADEFVVVTEKPDLKAIEKYIKETGDITFAHFGERGESLRIK